MYAVDDHDGMGNISEILFRKQGKLELPVLGLLRDITQHGKYVDGLKLVYVDVDELVYVTSHKRGVNIRLEELMVRRRDGMRWYGLDLEPP